MGIATVFVLFKVSKRLRKGNGNVYRMLELGRGNVMPRANTCNRKQKENFWGLQCQLCIYGNLNVDVDVTSQKPHSKCPPCRAPKLFPPPFYEVLGPSPELYSTQHYALPEKNKHKSVGKQWHKCAQCAKHSGIFIDSLVATPKRSLGKGSGHEWIM